MIKRLFQPFKELKMRKTAIMYALASLYFGALRPITSLIVSKGINAMETKNIYFFKIFVIISLVLIVSQYTSSYFIRTFRRVSTRKFQRGLFNLYLDKYLKADNNAIETLGTGQSNSILQKGCNSWQSILFDIFLRQGVRIIVTVITILSIIMIVLGRKMFLIVIGVFVIILTIAWNGNKRMRGIRKERRDVMIKIDRNVIRFIMSKFEILQNSKIAKELKRILDFANEAIKRDKKESKGFILASDIPRAILDIIKRGIITRYGLHIFSGSSTIAEFTLIWMMMNQITGVLFDANDIVLNYYDQITYVQKLWTTFDNMPKLKGYEEGNSFTYNGGNIKLTNIYFGYGNNPVLENFCLNIEGGKKTAFVGESGSGKTTLLKLISGYVHPDNGNIEIDNQKLGSIALKSYYKHIGYLTQDPNVFDGTIYDNLLYGTVKKPTQKEIDKAIKLARCEFISSFKDGIDTEIGEKGIKLSGGQKQRLAIAKLFLKDPSIVFLDEPTSALDSFSEEDIAKAFSNLFKGRTVVVVAHRLQTVKEADIIHVLNKKGKIVESGTHQELLEKKGIYYKMIELQSGF